MTSSRWQAPGLPHPVGLPFIKQPGLWPSYRANLRRYTELMMPVYRALHDVAGGAVLVDSMKIPSHVYVMTHRMQGLDVRIAHHIRDSRGFAYSNTKRVEKQGAAHRGSYRGRRPPWKSALRWTWFNESFDHLQRNGVPSLRVRYEDLVHDPVPELRRVAGVFDIDLSPDHLGSVHDDGIDFSPGHIASGSRWRMRSGRIPLREDVEWAEKLGERDRLVVTMITRPLLRRYGYRASGPLHEVRTATGTTSRTDP